MKKRIIGLVLGTLAISLGAFLGVSNFNKKTELASAYYTPSTHYEVSDTASELASYYSSISDSDTGTSLLSKLQSLNSTKRKRTMGYSGIGTDTSGAVIYTDYDLNSTAKDSNGQTYGTKVASFYTKTAATSWNREHMWPNSHGGNNVEADILHTRPTISSENSSRGNSFYVEGKNNSSSGWDPYTAGYAEWCRGECARVILYCVVAYPSFTLSDADSHSTSNSNKDNMMGNMNTLIKWHFNYLPNVYEKNRNDGAEYLQGNRNPFVDHPEYVARIWSNFNSTVSALCTANENTYSNWEPGNYCNFGSNTLVNNDGVAISASSASISVGSTATLSATASNSGTIYWTTSNSSVASISSSSSASGANITITGVSAGTATITAKATINGTQYSKTCTVTVTKVVSSLSKGSTSPTKTTYTAGESFDPTGLTITATYSDSTTGDVTSSIVWTPDPLTAGTTSVTGTFGGKTVVISGLTVNAAAEPESYSIVPADLATSYPTSATSYTASSGINVTALNTANFSSKIQFKKSGGYLYNNDSLNLKTLTLTSVSGTLTVYAGTSKNPSSTTISGSNGVYNLSGYNYFKIINSSGSVATCTGITVTIASQQQEKSLSSISVSTAPTKTSYTAGEYFNPTGLVITRTYSDSTSDTYTYSGHTSEFTFSPSTSTALTTSNTNVTITYGGKSCSQAITVNAAKTLSSISVSTAPTKTSYTAGETFDPTGLVIRRNYSDSTYDTYTYSGHTSEFTFSPSTSTALTTSNASVTITYGGKSTTQAITVNAASKTLSSISISGQKTSFTIDESFSFGGTVTAHFSDSSSSDVTASATFTGYNMSVAGNYTVTVSYTYGSTTKTTTYSISVTSSGGGGGGTEEGSQRITASTSSTYYQSGDICPTGSTSSATATCDAFDVSWLKNSGSNSIMYTYAEMRVYTSHSFTITPKEDYTITSVVITANSSSYANAVGGSSLTNCTKNVNNVTVTLTPTSGTSAVGFTNSAQSRINYIVVNYEYESSSSSVDKTLSGISVSTAPSKTIYTVGEYFDPTGLVITRTYSDSTSDTYTYSEHTSEFDFNPSLETALYSGLNTVFIYYGGEMTTQSIVVNDAPTGELTASLIEEKTFYVGEHIHNDYIEVYKGSTKQYDFLLEGSTDYSYTFTYADAPSGGGIGYKTFTISVDDESCSLTVQVQRKAYEAASGSDTKSITYTDLPTSYQTSTSEREAASGVKFIAYNLANYSSKMQFKASGGYFQTTQAMTLKSLTINNRESNALTVYGSTNGSSFSSAISGTNDVYDLTGYSYVKVMKNGSGAAYCASLTIEVAGLETAENVANDIMYEDTINQCVEKLDVVLLELNNLSESELNTFTTSSDYVIATARERLNAWAVNQGKIIDYSTPGEVVANAVRVPLANSINKSVNTTLILVLSSIGVISIVGIYFYLRKRKEND